ncbi:hypothetical protein A2572_01095 [Candidatus Collierbacteria bacterium RIFOXYD1_FULL_40_9]|uniref:PD-(D/E)XK endonuclease-like domain-containing protein n=1 Tax=Candidatus Collierbacteria bacterium RIFOXYD1_FULL_40_9 TaxID=1817731 RepID=A0A1F5FP33_9BACT|nr:MAG: hypothetical protein A2572_01095 [Candidatus Collierbacteria bacterium RIFOXYD1_FULL_40_9]
MKDKFTATWVSHTSISDYLRCPRSYYLKNIYKDRENGKKIQIVSPALSLGSAIHEVLEGLSQIPTQKRFDISPIVKFETVWVKFSGKLGGFPTEEKEIQTKERGKQMLRKVMDNPGPLARLSVKLKQDFLYYWLSEDENLILCGKIDWLEYLKEINAVHIIDFKTSKKEENPNSLQLPIYYLLAKNCQTRPIEKLSYWYLEYDTLPTRMDLPELDTANSKVLEIARKIKLARKLENFNCPSGKKGCPACQSLEAILRGEGEKVGESERHNLYYLTRENNKQEEEIEEMIL